ncbi:acyl-CoA dehydrogenase family protein [Pseudofrankia asymbiotica]|uniref:Acyl-CoA dehydrogenase n=1 Tax=Pseudofrankia asymbiotica TaxID=1834516 RepID=A0A1V2IEV2_9ACTN|nr:acyl-CoA dehydrogenase family protein [Pseudofrankia asymbiotica]ONH31732.1 acyl-CoA dehydrogenase [Pseudofrankia asymbiotica]
MTFTLSEEHTQLRQAVRGFFAETSPESEVRRLMADPTGFDRAVWKRMGGELGLLGLALPRDFGGQGYSTVELSIVLEEMGRSLLCAPFLSSVVLAANALLVSGDLAAQKQYLPGIAAGETIAALAVTEEAGGWDPAGVRTRATRAARCWTLTGTKSFVLDGHVADVVLVVARTPSGFGMFAVPGDAPGLERHLLPTMDQTRKQASLTLRDVPATLVGDEVAAWSYLDPVLVRAAVALGAEQVGGAQRVLEMATEHARNRIQFGRPIGSFQAIKHKAANTLVAVESARSAVYHASLCAETHPEDLPVAAAIVKAYCSPAYVRATKDNIQIHGGIGFTWEHSAHLYFKRAKSSELLFGDPTLWRARLADQLGL